MRQTHVLTVLAIIAVIGAVSVPNSLAVAWRLDVGDRHVVDRDGLKWHPLIHTVGDTDAPPIHAPEYQTLGHPQQGPLPFINDQSRDTEEYKSGSPSNESRYGPNPSGNYFQKESSQSSNLPYGGFVYGGVPTTPSADPMIKELSR